MSDKFIVILGISIMAILFMPVIVGEYQKSQCRIEAIKAGVEADKINTACGLKWRYKVYPTGFLDGSLPVVFAPDGNVRGFFFATIML